MSDPRAALAVTDSAETVGSASALAAARSVRLAQIAVVAFAGLACLAVALAFVVPAISALVPAFFSGETGPAKGLSRVSYALRFTLVQAAFSSLAAVVLGIPAAFLVAKREFPGRRLLLASSGVPLCVPPVIIALAFVLFYGRQGYLNAVLMALTGAREPPVTFLYSLAGLVIAHGFYNFPVVMRTVSRVWERIPETEEDAARLLGASEPRVFLTVTAPHLSGAILSSGALVFLYCFFSFVIVLLFGGIGGTTLEVELYQAARSSLDFRLAGTIALVETALALCVVALYRGLESRLSAGATGFASPVPRVPVRSGAEAAGAFAFLAFLAVFFAGPLLSVLVRSFTPTGARFGDFSLSAWRFLASRGGFFPALASTVAVSLASAGLATVAALFLALAAGKRDRAGLSAVALVPLAVSSVMLSFGWNLVVPRGNGATLAFAQAAVSWPFAWTQVRSALARVPRSVDDAAALLSPRRLDATFRVRLPLVARGALAGFALSFAIGAGDATLPVTLSLGGFENLSLMLFRLAGSYRFPEACACAVVLASLSALVFLAQDAEVGDGRA